MTVFSVLSVSAALALFSSPAAGAIGFDMISNGRYWWGGSWQHRPNGGETNDCLCIKGWNPKLSQPEGYCHNGLKFNDHIEEQYLGAPFDTSKPIDITIHGGDALWVDRFKLSVSGGERIYGAQNTIGYCLSTNSDSSFDQYATHNGCVQTLSLYPNGNVYAYGGRAGYHREQWLLDRMTQACSQIKGRRLEEAAEANMDSYAKRRRRAERRRASWGSQMGSMMEKLGQAMEGSGTPMDVEDEDPAGETTDGTAPPGGRNALNIREAIKMLVLQNEKVTDEQIDSALNKAMLKIVEMQEDDEGAETVQLIPEIESDARDQLIPELENNEWTLMDGCDEPRCSNKSKTTTQADAVACCKFFALPQSQKVKAIIADEAEWDKLDGKTWAEKLAFVLKADDGSRRRVECDGC